MSEHPFRGQEHLPSSTAPCHIPPSLAAAAGPAVLILPSCPLPAWPWAGAGLGDLPSLQKFSFICAAEMFMGQMWCWYRCCSCQRPRLLQGLGSLLLFMHNMQGFTSLGAIVTQHTWITTKLDL